MTSETDVEKAIGVATEKFGPLTAAVNCAGIGIAQRTVTKKGPHSLSKFQQVVNVNVVGTFNVIRLVAAAMAESQPYSQSGERGMHVLP